MNNAEEREDGLMGTASFRFGHDFGRIRIYSSAEAAIPTKSAISKAGNECEQQAEGVSEHLTRTPEFRFQRNYAHGGGRPECLTEPSGREHESSRAKTGHAGDTGQTAVPPIVRHVLRSPGRPLDPATRAFMELRFRHDFSGVRVHLGPAAEQSARIMNARAYTVGRGIVWGLDRFAPATGEGRRLLAHELTHVVQGDSPASNPARQPSSVETLEHEARRVAAAVCGAGTMPPIGASARGLMVPLRQSTDDPGRPTFGNLPRDMPNPEKPLGRVVLREEGGVWYEERRGGKKFRAAGSYDFVVQEGKIWAVRSSNIHGRGHTEAAAGKRVEYAGTVQFGTTKTERGVVQKWTNASGHYGPSSNSRFVQAAGLPMDKFEPLKRKKGFTTQLPVFQPPTRPRGKEPPKKPRGPPPLGASMAHIPASKTGTSSAPPKGSGPPVGAPGVTPTGGRMTGQTPTRANLSSDTARAIARLDAEAIKATEFTGRIRTYVAAYNALRNAISLLDTIDAAQRIFAHGTVFEKEQSEADKVAAQSAEALRAAESSTAGNAYFGAIIDIGDAIKNRDQQALFALAGSLAKLQRELSESARKINAMSADIDAQAQAMLRAARNNKRAATQGMNDAAMAQAAALYISTEKLGNTLRGAGENYKSAAETLNALTASVDSAASEAEEAAWALGYARIIKAQQEIDRQERPSPRR